MTELQQRPAAVRFPGRDGSTQRALDQRFDGELIRPGHPRYDQCRRVWNGSIDRRPALIARCSGVSDVVAALRFARDGGYPIAVRGGGHSFPGLSVCDDGVVIDLAPMKHIDVDVDAGIVRAGAGVLLGELDAATQQHGMAVPIGSVTHTGLAGLTLGGGIGWLMRKHGLTVDQLLSVDLVTADGRQVRASAEENPDLFWGVRGGGGNFGIATRFTFRLQPVGPNVLSSLLMWPLEQGEQVIRAYREWVAAAPDELTTALILRRAPALELVPEDVRGRPVVGIGACWIGPEDDGVRVLEPMRHAGSPVVEATQMRPFLEQQAMFDASFPHGIWVYSKAADLGGLTNGAIGVLLDNASRIRSPRSTMTAWHMGGAVARVGELDTAFGGRSSVHLVDIAGVTESEAGFAEERDWANASWSALTPHEVGVYVNWLMDEGEAHVRRAYGEERFRRLQELKRTYDPENVFRLNQNIPPE